MIRSHVLPAALVLLVSAQALPADELEPAQVSRFLAELGSDEYLVREEAFRRLWSAGPGLLSTLEAAREAAEDVEVRSSIEALVFRARWRITPDLVAAFGADVLEFQRLAPDERAQFLVDVANRSSAVGRGFLEWVATTEPDADVLGVAAALCESEFGREFREELERRAVAPDAPTGVYRHLAGRMLQEPRARLPRSLDAMTRALFHSKRVDPVVYPIWTWATLQRGASSTVLEALEARREEAPGEVEWACQLALVLDASGRRTEALDLARTALDSTRDERLVAIARLILEAPEAPALSEFGVPKAPAPSSRTGIPDTR